MLKYHTHPHTHTHIHVHPHTHLPHTLTHTHTHLKGEFSLLPSKFIQCSDNSCGKRESAYVACATTS